MEKHVMENITSFMSLLQKEADKITEEYKKKCEEERKRLEKEEALKRQEYRAKLKPVSKEEFMKRFVELSKKNDEWEKYKKDNGILYISVGFGDIIELIRNAKDGLDYAEILDRTESRLNFFTNDVKRSIEETNKIIDFDKIAKEIEENRKKSLGWRETTLRENIRKEITSSKIKGR